jgi:hypothetical protein
LPLAVYTLHLPRAAFFHFNVCQNLTHAVVSILFSLQNPQPPSRQLLVWRRILRLSLHSTAASFDTASSPRARRMELFRSGHTSSQQDVCFPAKSCCPTVWHRYDSWLKGEPRKSSESRILSHESRRCVVTLFHLEIV